MFHYRWYPQADADNAGTLLPLGMDVSLPKAAHEKFKNFIAERQINRLYVVGSNDTTAPVIDASYRRFLAAMEHHLANQKFMLGGRPGAGDFGLYGQLTQLVGFVELLRRVVRRGRVDLGDLRFGATGTKKCGCGNNGQHPTHVYGTDHHVAACVSYRAAIQPSRS
jgi:hypothetical protein